MLKIMVYCKTAKSLLISLLPSILFSVAGFVVGLHTVAKALLPHVMMSPPSLDYQNMTDGAPISRLLDWNQAQIDALLTLRELNGPGLFLSAFALYGVLTVIIVRMLNPAFRLFRVVPERTQAQSSAALNASIQPDGLIKAGGILLLAGLPTAACWLLTAHWDARFTATLFSTGSAARWGWIWAVRLPVLFAALWVGFHPSGLAGDSQQRSLNVVPQSWPRLAFTGGAVGLAAFVIGRYAVP